jgi:hypothetical protein
MRERRQCPRVDIADWQTWWEHFGATELRHLLLLWWDPIGVYGVAEALDEYDTYGGRIGRMLREGTDAVALATYLGDVVEDQIGLARAPDHDAAVARRIVDWYGAAMTAARLRTSP